MSPGASILPPSPRWNAASTDWLGTHRANLTGDITLFDAIRRLPTRIPVVYASSAAVYGDAASSPDRRGHRCAAAFGLWRRQVRLRTACARCQPRARHPHRRAAPLQRLWAAAGPELALFRRNLDLLRTYPARCADRHLRRRRADAGFRLHVGDVVAALLAAMRLQPAGCAVFNVCTGVPTSVLDLARTIAELAGSKLGRAATNRRAPAKSGTPPARRSLARAALCCRSRLRCAPGSARCWTAGQFSLTSAVTQGEPTRVPPKAAAVALLVPPISLVVVALIGLLIEWRFRRIGRFLTWFALLALLVLAMPAVGGSLLAALERNLPLTPPPDQPPQAIVVLGGDALRGGTQTLAHCATWAPCRSTGCGRRVAVSSHGIADPGLPAAPARRRTTDRRRHGRQPCPRLPDAGEWIETKSRDTWENAHLSAASCASRASVGLRRDPGLAYAPGHHGIHGCGDHGHASTARLDRCSTPIAAIPAGVSGWRIATTPCMSGSAAPITRSAEVQSRSKSMDDIR